MAVLNFKCKKCSAEFDFDVDNITFGDRLSFEKEVTRQNCGKLALDDIELTEWGQTLVAEIYFLELKHRGNNKNEQNSN